MSEGREPHLTKMEERSTYCGRRRNLVIVNPADTYFNVNCDSSIRLCAHVWASGQKISNQPGRRKLRGISIQKNGSEILAEFDAESA